MRTLFLITVLLTCSALNCDGAKESLKSAAHAVLDCTKGELAPAVRDLAPMAERIVLDAIDPNGAVNWSPVKDYAKGMLTDIGRCAIAEGVARVLRPPVDDPNAPKVGGLAIDATAVRIGFAELKADVFGAVTFQTSAGRL